MTNVCYRTSDSRSCQKTGCALKAEVAQYAYYPEKAVDKLCELIRFGEYDCVIASTIQCTILAGLIAEQLKM